MSNAGFPEMSPFAPGYLFLIWLSVSKVSSPRGRKRQRQGGFAGLCLPLEKPSGDRMWWWSLSSRGQDPLALFISCTWDVRRGTASLHKEDLLMDSDLQQLSCGVAAKRADPGAELPGSQFQLLLTPVQT